MLPLITSAVLELTPHVPVQDPPELEVAEEAWTFSLALYGFDPPDEDAYASLIGYADRGPLHLETRYQYEALDSVSFFAGYRFSFEGEVATEIVPMLGAVGGDLDGIAPACSLDLSWKRLGWYVESEYVFDLDDSDESYLYAWSELTYAAADWFRFGMVGQRTRIREQELEVDRGLLVSAEFENLSLSLYLFNPDQDDPYLGFSLGVGF